MNKRVNVANGGSEPPGTKYLGWRIVCAAFVVTLALIAAVLSLHLVLDNYSATTSGGKSGEVASASAASVVAVLTPVMAGIVGIAGLFFGISATGSTRGREAEAQQAAAHATLQAAEGLKEATGEPTERAGDKPAKKDGKEAAKKPVDKEAPGENA